MGNHFHLAVETPKPTQVAGMKWQLVAEDFVERLVELEAMEKAKRSIHAGLSLRLRF